MLPAIPPERLNPKHHSLVHDLSGGLLLLVGLTLVASFWFPTTPLLIGGPNVLLGVVAVFLALLHCTITKDIYQPHLVRRPTITILVTLLLMMTWTVVTLLRTDTFSTLVVGSSILGPGIFLATVISASDGRRILILVRTVVGSVFLSAIFGFLVLHGDEWFWTFWLDVARPTPEFSEDVKLGRLAGLAPRVVNFSFHLVLAVPLSMAMLLYNPVSRKIIQRVYASGAYIITVTLITSIFLNGSRSSLIGATSGIILLLAAPMLRPAGDERVALIRRAALSFIALIIGVFVTLTTYNAIFQKNTPPDPGRVMSPASSCLDPIGEIFGEIRIVGRWSTDCISLQRPDSLARYYRFTLESPSLTNITAISDWTNPYLYLYSEETTLKLHAQNDNGANQLNARIVDGRLDPGTYIIEVTTYDPAYPGDFSLTITTDCADEETIVVTEYDENFWTSAWGESCPASSRQKEGVARYFRVLLSEASEFYIQVETDGLTPYIRLHLENRLGQVILPFDSTEKLIGDRWKHLKHTYHDLTSGNYVIEVTKNAVGVEGNFVISSWQTSSAEATPIEIPALPSSRDIQSRAEPPGQMNVFSADTKRLFDFSEGALLRLYMMITAVHYALEFPFGTGDKYVPQLSHIDKIWGRENVTQILASIPHNQFLYCLVQYGFPGLALLVALYVFVFASSLRSILLYCRYGSPGSPFLLIAPLAAMVAYLVNSLFHDHGPFTKDWMHLIIFGLVINSNLSTIRTTGERDL